MCRILWDSRGFLRIEISELKFRINCLIYCYWIIFPLLFPSPSVGKMVLTKMPLAYDPHYDTDVENITDQYKPPEGSKDNRLALLNAVRNTSRAKRFYEVPEETVNDVSFSIEDLETVKLGKPFVVVVKVKNNSGEPRHIDAVLSSQSVYYNGVKANVLKKSAGMVTVEPNADKEIRMTVLPEDYVKGIVE